MKIFFSFTKQEISLAFRRARFVKRISGLKVLKAFEPLQEGHGKLLIIIPRKSGKAHDRNRLRRQMREIFYTEKIFLVPMMFIVFVYQEAFDYSFDQLKTFLLASCRR